MLIKIEILFGFIGCVLAVAGFYLGRTSAAKKEGEQSATTESRLAALESRDITIQSSIERGEKADKLLCKAMIALLDNRITNNNIDNLKITKADLMEFLTEGV